MIYCFDKQADLVGYGDTTHEALARCKRNPEFAIEDERDGPRENPPKAIYDKVTADIIAQLKAGVAPWVKPRQGGVGKFGLIPYNGLTGKRYRGINLLILGFEGGEFFSKKQAAQKAKAAKLKDKARHKTIVFSKMLEIDTGEVTENTAGAETKKIKKIHMMSLSSVYDRNEFDGLPPSKWRTPMKALNAGERNEAIDAVCAASGADIRHGYEQAFYSRGDDFIGMLDFERFPSPADYYSTVLHELTHWTGAPHRLDRIKGKRFGDPAYAFEELVAEIGSAFCCAHLAIQGKLQHAEYVGHWIKALKDDHKAIFHAASLAEDAADFLLGKGAE